MNWFKRNVESISIACIPIAMTLGVIGIIFASLPTFILAGAICITGAVAFVTHSNQAEDEEHKMYCRNCGKEGEMALVYESGGVCRKCLLHIVKLPGVLRKS